MTTPPIDSTLAEWDAAREANDLERWVEHLDRIPVCDFFPLLSEREALTRDSKTLTLSQWLNYMGSRDDVHLDIEMGSTPADVRLAAATYLRWIDRVETLLRTSRLPNLPPNGVVQYFVDHLAASVLVEYKRIGSTVQLDKLLAIPNPEAYLDPLRALKHATTPAQLELLRRSLYSRHKIVIQRNTLLHIDRERSSSVFGPTIDTLFLNDWLHANRYALERRPENARFFEDPVPRSATAESLESGVSFLEVGCGNGLLTASFARNEVKIRSFAAIDISPDAISATYENVATQRQFSGAGITSRGRFTIGAYELESVPAASDLVVCNPPYIPNPPDRVRRHVTHPLSAATVGTELLQRVLRDAESLLAPTGELFMISSTLAEPEIREAVPASMTLEVIASRSVTFDVEAIRGEDEKQHVSWLRSERGLEVRKQQGLFHNIAIYRVSRLPRLTSGDHL